MTPSCWHRCIDSSECLTFCERFMIVTSCRHSIGSVFVDAIRTELRERGVSGLLRFVILCASVAGVSRIAPRNRAVPSFIAPRSLQLRPLGPQWLHQVKFDGCGCRELRCRVQPHGHGMPRHFAMTRDDLGPEGKLRDQPFSSGKNLARACGARRTRTPGPASSRSCQ